MLGLRYGKAQEGEQYRAAILLLAQSGLPTSDVEPARVTLLVASDDQTVVGCIGLETAGPFGLMRSLAVETAYRGRRIAHELYERMLLDVRARGSEALYALTNTAEGFLEKLGFTAVSRESVPEPVRATAQFSSLCPMPTAKAYCRSMADMAWYYPADVLRLQDSGAGARHFAVSLAASTLSYFEVDACGRFERHAHAGEQITMVLEGQLVFMLDDRTVCVEAGEMIAIGPGVAHAVVAGESPVRAVDAWSPARRDLSGN